MVAIGYTFLSYLLVLSGLVVIIGASYILISYTTSIMGTTIIKSEPENVLLSALYVWLPLILLVLSAIMFLAGFYYHRGKHENEIRKAEEIERHMVHTLVRKIETGK